MTPEKCRGRIEEGGGRRREGHGGGVCRLGGEVGGGGGEGWGKGDGGVGGGEGRGEGGGEGGGGGGVAQVMIEDQVSWGGGHWADEGAHQLFQSEFSQFSLCNLSLFTCSH